MRAIEVLHKTIAAPKELAKDLENRMIEAMEAYANLKIEAVKEERDEFRKYLVSERLETARLKEMVDTFNTKSAMEGISFEFLLRIVAKEAYEAAQPDCKCTEDAPSFDEWWGKRQLIIGDVGNFYKDEQDQIEKDASKNFGGV